MKYTVLDYLEDTAAKYPDKVAFADINESITWSKFVENSKKLSYFIAEHFDRGMAVPVMMEKSVKTLEYFFAALYAGCFYSYFDSTFPDSRLTSMIETLGVTKIISERKNEKKLSGLPVTALFTDEVIIENKESVQGSRQKLIIDTDPVYANFTSGTTGTPKAVLVNHKNVVDFLTCFTEIFEIKPEENIANQAPFDFDVSVKDIFSGVFTGATVHLVPKAYFSFPTKLLDYLEEREITTLIWAVSALCIISTLNGFSYKIPGKLKKIMFSGEVMPIKQLRKWKENVPDAEYINLYGPTEITCNCTYYRLPKDIPEDYVTPMGIPFPNERVFLLDENDNLITEKNIEGEICVSGSCVALGYYDNPKTEQVFVQNPSNKKFFERIYRTGDLGKYGDDDLFYYVGRKDTQIKHMGHRIELGEIEGTIEKNCSITRAVTIFTNNKIYAFYTTADNKPVEKKDIVTSLKTDLPVYMVPSDFIHIEEFPLTKNGKVDKRALEAKING
ncbi:amino acid adenylation domain-containing protein [Treponema sp.]|uniref:amino acid adenylation domain-containing protein n=1 Tax=Treponema sp. TaxID=166 RepID=UPI00388FEAC0